MRCTIDEVVDFIPDDQVDANLRKRANREVLHWNTQIIVQD